MLGGREGARGDLRGIRARGILEVGTQVGVLLDEPRGAATAQPGHVLPDEHLGVAVRARADPDRGDAQRDAARDTDALRIPTIGIGAGTISMTMAKQPAASSARASSISLAAPDPRPCTL